MSKTYTIATLNGLIIATVPDGGDIFAAVADAAARADIDIDFGDIDVTEGVTLTDEEPEPAFLDDEGPSDDLPTRITLPKS